MSRLVNKITKLERELQRDYDTLNKIEISRSAILHNFDLLKNLHRDFDVFPVLKSNAYGHGLEQVAEILKERTFPYIAVDGYFEALKIRTVSNQPVLIMSVIHPSNYQRLKFNNFSFVVGDRSALVALGNLNKKVKIHLDINTGMNRQGFNQSELLAALRKLKEYRKLEIEGVMSHLADADNARSDAYSQKQIAKFDVAVEQIQKAGYKPKFIHMANSPGSAKTQSKYSNAIRPGLALYGLNPLQLTDRNYKKYSSLQPALTLKSSVSKLVTIKAGDKVSYNGIFTAPRTMRLGILPLGYYEGIPLALNNKGQFMVSQVWARVTGKVCMNHTLIDASNKKIKLWDPVTVISAVRRDRNSVDRICNEFNLFNYEFVSGLGGTIRREIVD